MKQVLFTIRENTPLTGDVCRMVLEGDTGAITAPGQFVNVQVPGFTLRRPISVCDWEKGKLTLVYKIVGGGTAKLEEMKPGERLDILTGLGNGFDTAKSPSSLAAEWERLPSTPSARSFWRRGRSPRCSWASAAKRK